MNATSLVRHEQPLAEQIEQVVVGGDLSNLNASQRVSYYHKVCESVGLNPLTRPFEYLKLNGKLVLYARRDAADQLRTIHGISLSKPHIEYVDDLVIVTIEAANKNGRTDTDMGAVSCKGLQGEAKANAMMKAITKAKRRVTLSLAGLGWLDETEVDTIPGAQRVVVTETGEIVDGEIRQERTATIERESQPAIDGDEVFSRPGQGVANPPAAQATTGDDAPAAHELAIINQWQGPQDAQNWAVAMELCDNDNHAKQAWINVVRECRGYSAKNKQSVMLHFLRDRSAKLQARQPELATA